MTYDNEKRGVLFKNNRKEKDSHPDYNGTITIEGVEYYLSAWVKEGKNGKFFSLSIGKEKGAKAETHKGFDRQGDVPQRNDMNDEIPF
jgi:hypothetical protein